MQTHSGIAFRQSSAATVRVFTDAEQDIRADILASLIADKGGEQQIGTAERVLAEIVNRDVALLVTSNQAIHRVSRNNQKCVDSAARRGAT